MPYSNIKLVPSPYSFQEINDDLLIKPIMIDVVVLPQGILRNQLHDMLKDHALVPMLYDKAISKPD